MKCRNLIIIGTSHIAKQSLEEVKSLIENTRPDIICLELDKRRAYALLHNKASAKLSFKDIRKIGFKGYLFSIIGAWAERKLGDYAGVAPGEEMKTALLLAKQHSIKVACIDQDIELTLKRFSSSLSWREKWNFAVDIVGSVLSKKKRYMFDLRKVPSKAMIKRMISEVKQRYPNIYNVLVWERNEFMAKKLIRIMNSMPDKRVVAVVGAGHEEEILSIIKENINKIDISYTFSMS